jgi:hypothetical protein
MDEQEKAQKKKPTEVEEVQEMNTALFDVDKVSLECSDDEETEANAKDVVSQ